jgi:lipopolysaccharide export LptBFGC system permease protein LptF
MLTQLEAAYEAAMPYYMRSFFSGVSLQILVVMGLVEAIFLAERIPMVFRDVLANNANLFDTGLIFVCTSTQIFDLALPIAILVAVYWTIIRMRESRELLVLATIGVGPFQLLTMTLVIALLGQISSLIVSGVIDPASRYAQRSILFDAEFRALETGIGTGQFHYLPGRVAYAPAQSGAGARTASSGESRKLFVYEDIAPRAFRVITADSARLEGPDASGTILVKLGGFSSSQFSDPRWTPDPAPSPESADPTPCSNCSPNPDGTVHASLYNRLLSLDELLPFASRGTDVAELTVFDQFGGALAADPARRVETMRLLGERFARSLLCLLAPLIALAAVCLTSRATNYFALPLACLVLMALNVTSAWLSKSGVPSGPVAALAPPIAIGLLFAALLIALIMRAQGAMLRPQLARA